MVDTGNDKTGPSVTIDTEGLRRFLRDRKLAAADDLRVENISFGHSNEVHLVHFECNSWALRRPPRGPLLPTAHDVMREFRVINALQNTPVPVPRAYAACDDSRYRRALLSHGVHARQGHPIVVDAELRAQLRRY